MKTRRSDCEHRYCFACGRENPDGLALRFSFSREGEVTAVFTPKKVHQGYDGLLHGGIVCTLLDAAMTRLLMDRGTKAVTADLNVRFKKPVPIAEAMVVRARIDTHRRRFFQLSAELSVNGVPAATAVGKFVKMKDELSGREGDIGL